MKEMETNLHMLEVKKELIDMAGFMEFLGWIFLFFIVFSLLLTPGGLAVLFVIAAVGLLMLPFVALGQMISLANEMKKEKEE